MTRYPFWLLLAAVIIGIVVALLVVIPTAEVKQDRGTAPSTLDTQRPADPCEALAEPQRAKCLEERKR